METYDIKKLKKAQTAFAQEVYRHFFDFFTRHKEKGYKGTKQLVSQDIRIRSKKTVLDDIGKIEFTGPAFYLILSDYQKDENRCIYEVGDLKVVYRGHSSKVQRRLISHLANDHYKEVWKEMGWEWWSNCIKLDGKSGINITEPPYREHRWRVIVHKMTDSSALMREQAEKAFTAIFKQPLGSADDKRRTRKSSL